MKKPIHFLFRKKRSGAHSIEQLFFSIQEEISSKVETTRNYLPYSGASFKSILGNLCFGIKYRNKITHLTGEINYMALVLGGKCVLTIHDIHSAFGQNKIKNWLIKLLWFWLPAICVKKITVISSFSKQELSRLIPWAKHKIICIHNPVNGLVLESAKFLIESPTPINGIFKILHLGTKPNKNLERTIKALEGLPIELHIVGKLDKKQLDLLNNCKIKYTNAYDLTFEEIIQSYLACDIVCFVSTYEGFGMPVIEAQTLGKPILTSNIASIPEIALDSAVLIDPFSVQAIREGLLSLLTNEHLRKEKIVAGYKNIERFKIQNITEQYINMYNTL